MRSPRDSLSTAAPLPADGRSAVRSPRDSLSTAAPLPAYGRSAERNGGSAQGNPRPCPCVLPASARLRPNHCAQRRKCTRPTPPLSVRSPRGSLSIAAPPPVDGRTAVRKGGVHKANPAPARALSPRQLVYGRALCPLMSEAPSAGWGGEGKGGRPLAQQPAPVCLRPRPRRLNGHPASAGGRENDRMAHRRTTTPTHRTQRGNDTCTIRVPRRKGAQSVVHNLYFSSSRPASFCTTFPQSCTDRPVTYRKEHKWPLEGLIFRVLPPAFPPFPPKAIVQNTPAPPPFSPRKTPRFAPTRNRARTLASAGRDNTPRPAHSSRFQRDTNGSAARRKLIFAPPKAENGGVFGLKC